MIKTKPIVRVMLLEFMITVVRTKKFIGAKITKISNLDRDIRTRSLPSNYNCTVHFIRTRGLLEL